MNEVKKYLQSARLMRLKIENKQSEILELKNKLGVHSPSMDTIPCDSHSNSQSLILYVIEKEDELNNDILCLVKERQKVIDLIDKVVDPLDYQILYSRYILEESIRIVARKLNLDERTVRRRTNRTCYKLCEICDENVR